MSTMNRDSIVFDFKVIHKLDLTFIDYLYLVYKYIYNREFKGVKPDLDKLLEKKYIKVDTETGEVSLRESANELIEFLTIKSFNEFKSNKIIKKSKKQVTAEVTERISEYRSKWKGLKAGAMGGRKDCIQKLTRWMLENPEYSFDQILNAADLYLSTEGMNTRYLQRADYFIFKQDVHKGEASRLSAFIDELEEPASSGDWTSQLI